MSARQIHMLVNTVTVRILMDGTHVPATLDTNTSQDLFICVKVTIVPVKQTYEHIQKLQYYYCRSDLACVLTAPKNHLI